MALNKSKQRHMRQSLSPVIIWIKSFWQEVFHSEVRTAKAEAFTEDPLTWIPNSKQCSLLMVITVTPYLKLLRLLKTNFNVFANHSLYTKLCKISFLIWFKNTVFNWFWLFVRIAFYQFCVSKTELSRYLEKTSGMEGSSLKCIGKQTGVSESIQGVPFLSFQVNQ